MKIVIRSRYINTFLVCLKSLRIFYPEYLKDVTVQVQHDKDDDAFIEAGQMFGFHVSIVYPDPSFYHNEWAYMLYKSLQRDNVVSLDDDIVFLKPGLFKLIDDYHNETGANIVGTKYVPTRLLSTLTMHSHLLSVRGLSIGPECFASKEDMQIYDGCDTALIGLKYVDKTVYLEDKIHVDIHSEHLGYYGTEYYIHVGGVSWTWNAIYNRRLGRC
jgi:hypothetical protein